VGGSVAKKKKTKKAADGDLPAVDGEMQQLDCYAYADAAARAAVASFCGLALDRLQPYKTARGSAYQILTRIFGEALEDFSGERK
jgi:hypothetical protein